MVSVIRCHNPSAFLLSSLYRPTEFVLLIRFAIFCHILPDTSEDPQDFSHETWLHLDINDGKAVSACQRQRFFNKEDFHTTS
jgi:hypothetical protein